MASFTSGVLSGTKKKKKQTKDLDSYLSLNIKNLTQTLLSKQSLPNINFIFCFLRFV